MKKEDFLVRIVDDDPNQRDGLELVLSLRGWKSKAYPDGTTFLNEDNFLTPGCVILDLAMPEKDRSAGSEGNGTEESCSHRHFPFCPRRSA